MNAANQRPKRLTPGKASLQGKLSELYRELAAVHEELARESAEEFFDQRTSPLGSRLHCRLVRTGVLTGYRAGHRILVRRADVDAYLEQHRIAPLSKTGPVLDDIDARLAKAGGRRA